MQEKEPAKADRCSVKNPGSSSSLHLPTLNHTVAAEGKIGETNNEFQNVSGLYSPHFEAQKIANNGSFDTPPASRVVISGARKSQ